MEKSEQKERVRWGVLLLFLQAAETAVCCYVLGGTLMDVLRCTLWMLLFGGIAVIYLMARAGHFHQKHFCFPVVSMCVLSALPCALFYDRLRPMAGFYLGAVLIAALVDQGTGIVFVIYFCAAAMRKGTGDMEEAVSLLALGVVLCLLAGFLEKKQGILEVFLLSGIVTAILHFLRTSLHESMSYQSLGLALLSTAAVLVCALLLMRLYARLVRDDGKKGSGRQEVTAQTCEALLAPDAVLMVRMKNEAQALYQASAKLAAVAAVAAGQVAADAGRCRVIAMYREVGKLAKGQESAAAGIALMREVRMPEGIIRDIAGINRKEPRPCTKEAAIVFLAVAVMGIWNHPKTRAANITQDKVIDKVFAVLLNKGVLDEAGFSVKEYSQLKKSLKMEFAFPP